MSARVAELGQMSNVDDGWHYLLVRLRSISSLTNLEVHSSYAGLVM